jgi:hypothetical protein
MFPLNSAFAQEDPEIIRLRGENFQLRQAFEAATQEKLALRISSHDQIEKYADAAYRLRDLVTNGEVTEDGIDDILISIGH